MYDKKFNKAKAQLLYIPQTFLLPSPVKKSSMASMLFLQGELPDMAKASQNELYNAEQPQVLLALRIRSMFLKSLIF